MTKIALVIIPLIALFSTSAVRAEAPVEKKDAKAAAPAAAAAPATESKEATKDSTPVAEAKTDESALGGKTEAKAGEAPVTAEKKTEAAAEKK